MKPSQHSILWSLTGTFCLALLLLPTLSVSQREIISMSMAHASEMADTLREKAARQGLVRVTVKVQQDPGCEKKNMAISQSECRNTLEATKQKVLNTMATQDVVRVESMEGLPSMVLEITLHGLNALLSSDLLESIQEDVPERSF